MEDAYVLTDWLVSRGHKVRVGQLRGCDPHVETTKEGFEDFKENFTTEKIVITGYSHNHQRADWREINIFNDLESESYEKYSLISKEPIK